MSLAEETIPLSLFLPSNIPDINKDDLDGQLTENCAEDVSLSLRAARVVLDFMDEHTINGYDDSFLSLDAAIERGSFNCVSSTAIASLVGRVLDGIVACVPVIETSRSNRDELLREKYLHAKSAIQDEDGTVTGFDQWLSFEYYGTAEYPILSHSSTELRQLMPDLLTSNGITQLRYNFEDNLEILTDYETRKLHDPDTTKDVYTFFCGEEGMKSYLNTIEVMSARNAGTNPEYWPNQLIPRL